MCNLLARSALMFVIVLATTMPGQSAEAPIPGNTALSDAAIEQRIDFIEQRLDSHETHGQIWYWSWMAINGGSMVGLGISAGLSKHEDDQVNNGVQAGLGAIGVADLRLRPLEARYGADPIRGLPNARAKKRLRSCAPPKASCAAMLSGRRSARLGRCTRQTWRSTASPA